MERTPQECEELVNKAIFILEGGAKALDTSSRIDFQRGRSARDDYRDWAVCFTMHGDRLPYYLLPGWFARIGRRPWEERLRIKAVKAVALLAERVPTELWVQGMNIDI